LKIEILKGPDGGRRKRNNDEGYHKNRGKTILFLLRLAIREPWESHRNGENDRPADGCGIKAGKNRGRKMKFASQQQSVKWRARAL